MKKVSQGVKNVIAKLLTDDCFKRAFVDDCRETLLRSGFELTEEEIDTLCRLDASDLTLDITVTTVRKQTQYGLTVEGVQYAKDRDE